MYNVSQIYKNLISENDRLFSIAITVEHEKGTLNATDKDLSQGSFSYEAASQPGDDFTLGGVVAASIQFTLMGEYEGIDFLGAIVTPVVYLEDEDNPNWKEGVPLGLFFVDEQTRARGNVTLKALDRMIFLDEPYEQSVLTYPASLLSVFSDICNTFNIPIGSTSFLHSTYNVPERPVKDGLTYRDVLSMVAELSGSFAHCDRLGRMVLKWYEGAERDVLPVHRFSFKPSENQIQITGVSYKEEGNVYLAGTEGYVIDLTGNMLFQEYESGVLSAIYNRVGGTIFYPYTADWQGDPALEVGDRVKHTSVEGLEYSSIVNHTSYKYRGQCTISAKSKTPEARKFKGSTSKQLNEVIQYIRESDRNYNDQLTSLEEAKVQAMRLLTGALGGYYIEEEGAIYIANAPTLQDATEYWVWNINGFGHFVDGVLDTAITSDSSILASLIHGGLITADMIKLTSTKTVGDELSSLSSSMTSIESGQITLSNTVSSLSGTVSGHTSTISSLSSDMLSLSSTVGGHSSAITTIQAGMADFTTTVGGTTYIDGGMIRTGTLVATGVDITGKITATSGSIAGVEISGSRLEVWPNVRNGNKGLFYITSSPTATYRMMAYDNVGSGSRMFSVSNDGELYAKNATISGTITATYGNIGPLSISSAGLTYTSRTQITASGYLRAAGANISGTFSGTVNASGGLYTSVGGFDYQILGVNVKDVNGNTVYVARLVSTQYPPSPTPPGSGTTQPF